MSRSKKIVTGGLLASIAAVAVLISSLTGQPSPVSAAQMLLDKVKLEVMLDESLGSNQNLITLLGQDWRKNATIVTKEEFVKEFARPLEHKTPETDKSLQMAAKFLHFNGPKDVHVGMAIDSHDLMLFMVSDDARDNPLFGYGWETPQYVEKFGTDMKAAAKKFPFNTYFMGNPEINGQPINPTEGWPGIILYKAHDIGRDPLQPSFQLSTSYHSDSTGYSYDVYQSTLTPSNSQIKLEEDGGQPIGGLKPAAHLNLEYFLDLRKRGEEVNIKFAGQDIKAYYGSVASSVMDGATERQYKEQNIVWVHDDIVYRIYASGFNEPTMPKDVLLQLPGQLKPYKQ